MKILRLALLALACSAPLVATAQWQWVDKDGRKVFSDRPPPPDIAPNRIVKAPGGRMPASEEAPVAAADPAKAGAPAAAKAPTTDKDLEAKKKQAEQAKTDKRRAEEADFARLQAENCKRARAGKATLEAGGRIGRTNEKGEREVLDDKQIASEIKIANDVIARDCKT
jgi:hypothetical protein